MQHKKGAKTELSVIQLLNAECMRLRCHHQWLEEQRDATVSLSTNPSIL